MAFKEDAIKFFKALGDRTRYEVICRLLEVKEVSCSDLRECFSLSDPALSHHYKVLENAGLITSRKEGSFVHYRLNEATLNRFVPGFADVHRECQTETEERII